MAWRERERDLKIRGILRRSEPPDFDFKKNSFSLPMYSMPTSVRTEPPNLVPLLS